MKLMCRIFGHKPVQIVEEYPYFCERCLEDLVQDDKGKWVINKDIFSEMLADHLQVNIEDVKTEELEKKYNNYKKGK